MAEGNEDLRDDIEDAVTEAVERMAEHGAASAWSTLSDADSDDLDEQGFNSKTSIVIAIFGNYSTAVNGDVLIDGGWMKRLRIPKADHPQTWTDIGISELATWMKRHGYEAIAGLGGDVPTTEEEVDLDSVIRVVARDMNVPASLVSSVVDSLCDRDLSCHGGTLAYLSVSGEVDVYAVPKE